MVYKKSLLLFLALTSIQLRGMELAISSSSHPLTTNPSSAIITNAMFAGAYVTGSENAALQKSKYTLHIGGLQLDYEAVKAALPQKITSSLSHSFFVTNSLQSPPQNVEFKCISHQPIPLSTQNALEILLLLNSAGLTSLPKNWVYLEQNAKKDLVYLNLLNLLEDYCNQYRLYQELQKKHALCAPTSVTDSSPQVVSTDSNQLKKINELEKPNEEVKNPQTQNTPLAPAPGIKNYFSFLRHPAFFATAGLGCGYFISAWYHNPANAPKFTAAHDWFSSSLHNITSNLREHSAAFFKNDNFSKLAFTFWKTKRTSV